MLGNLYKMGNKFCINCVYRNRLLEDEGDKKAKVVIVSGSPTDEEIAEGTQFTDKGKELWEHILKKNKITEKKYGKFYYINSIKCSIPSQKFKGKDKIINQCCKDCHDDLIDKLSAYDREIIVTLGTNAIKTITNVLKGAISTRRGAIIKSDLARLDILPILDPREVVYLQHQYPLLNIDIKKMSDMLSGKKKTLPDCTFKHLTTKKSVLNFIAEIKDVRNRIKFISADIETTGLSAELDEFTCIGIYPSTGKENYKTHKGRYGLENNGKYVVRIIANLQLFKFFVDNLPKKYSDYLWHNGKFDLKFLRSKGLNKHKISVCRDTQVLSYLLDEKPGRHALERCVLDHLQYDKFKDVIAPYLLLGTTFEKLKRSNFSKTAVLRDVVLEVQDEIISSYVIPRSTEDIEVYIHENRPIVTRNDKIKLVTNFLNSMYLHLIKKDMENIVTLQMLLQYIRTGIAKKAYALIPKKILFLYCAKDIVNMLLLHNVLVKKVKKDKLLWKAYTKLLIPASNSLLSIELNGMPIMKKRVKYAYDQYKPIVDAAKKRTIELSGDPEYNPNSGDQTIAILDGMGFFVPNTQKATLKKLEDKCEFVKSLLEYSSNNKFLRDNITKYLDYPTKRVHSSYSVTGTLTGRLGSTGENNQNVAKIKIIRRMYAVSKKRIIIACDYSQAELRALAQLSRDIALIKIFADGLDLHSAVAMKMFGKLFTDLQRRVAKTVNFGIIYGVEAPTLSVNTGLSLGEAQDFIDGWFKSFATAKTYMDATRNLRDFELITAYGRRRRFHIIGTDKDRSLQNEAGNFPYQSLCSDFCLDAQIRLDGIIDNWKGNIKQINIIHDDNVFEMDNKVGKVLPWINKVVNTMEQVPIDMGFKSVPFKADPSIGTEWSRLIDINLGRSMEENRYVETIDADDYGELSGDDLDYRRSLKIKTYIEQI